MRLSCERAAAQHPDWTVERLRDAFVATYRELEDRMETGELSFPSQVPFRIRSWEDTLRRCGLSPALGEELAHVYLEERRKRYRMYDDVPAALNALVRDYRLVLVTNGMSDLQREKVAAVGLDRWFDRIVVSGEVQSWKPDTRIFRHALTLAEVACEEAVMIGDNLERDIAGAHAVGIRTAWVRRYEHLTPMDGITPHVTVQDLPELAQALAAAPFTD